MEHDDGFDIEMIDGDPVLSALYSVLNVQGPATMGAELPCWRGLNVRYHFDQVREAIKVREAELRVAER